MSLARSTKPTHSKIAAYAIYASFFVILAAIALIITSFQSGRIGQDAANLYLTVAVSLFFPSLALSYMLNRGIKTSELAKSLFLSNISARIIGIGLVIFFILFTMEVLTGLISTVSGTQIDTNVGLLLSGAPIWFYIFSAIIAPINEEIFFRGFLVPRIGIVLSAAVFAILHASYGSTFGVEIIAAFIFGIVAGYVVKRTKSLYPSIIAHILINAIAVLSFAVV
ncbi:MAG: CPBP family intramembrane metalloprotease [Candidatus Micrarchaeota archaeon]|nr:CPBP family intramembrane metalloprotease [Candidatus Micrarchaeota archaeon]